MRIFWAALITCSGASAAEAREAPRVFLADTAAVQPEGGAFATSGLSHRGDPLLAGTFGFAGLADLSLELTDLGLGPTAAAVFKARLAPGLALGLRKSALRDEVAAQLFLVGAVRLGPLDLQLGGDAWDARTARNGALADGRQRGRLRPSAAVAWRPPHFPRTTVLAELVFRPRATGDRLALAWIVSWGVRYQALSWGSIELGVHMPEAAVLGEAAVFVRVNAGPRGDRR